MRFGCFCIGLIIILCPPEIQPVLGASQLSNDIRVAIVVGTNIGVGADIPLSFAERDAEQVHQLLIDVGGVDPSRAYLVVGQDATAVRNAILEVKGRILELTRQMPTTLIFYASTHADEANLHLAGTLLPIAELKQALAEIPTDFRLVIVDGCRTPVRHGLKGGKTGPQVDVVLNSTNRIEGEIFLRSTGPGEPAQEWEYLRGALFTHHLLAALRGVADLNRDGRVSLGEAYSYTYRKTAGQAAVGGARPQHPSFDFQAHGFGEWIFSQPARLGATIELAQELDGTIWIANRGNELVAEISKRRGERVQIAVKPGWYRVVRPQGNRAEVIDLNLNWRSQKQIEPGDFVSIDLRKSTLRGSTPYIVRPWSIGAGYSLSTPPLPDIGPLHFVQLLFGREFGTKYLQLGAGYARTRFATEGPLEIHQHNLKLRLTGGFTVPFRLSTAAFGLDLSGMYVYQNLDRQDDTLIDSQLIGDISTKSAWIPSVGLTAAGRLPLTDRLAVSLEALGGVAYIPKLDDKDELIFTAQVQLTALFRL